MITRLIICNWKWLFNVAGGFYTSLLYSKMVEVCFGGDWFEKSEKLFETEYVCFVRSDSVCDRGALVALELIGFSL